MEQLLARSNPQMEDTRTVDDRHGRTTNEWVYQRQMMSDTLANILFSAS